MPSLDQLRSTQEHRDLMLERPTRGSSRVFACRKCGCRVRVPNLITLGIRRWCPCGWNLFVPAGARPRTVGNITYTATEPGPIAPATFYCRIATRTTPRREACP